MSRDKIVTKLCAWTCRADSNVSLKKSFNEQVKLSRLLGMKLINLFLFFFFFLFFF